MFKSILLPLDGSATAEQALLWAKRYAAPSKALVVLLQVLHPEYPLKGLPFRAGADQARKYLQGIERELNFAGIPARIVLRNEPVSRTIIDAARRHLCDLIIMTSRGASKVVRWLLGGVAQQVMRLSPIPVLIVRSRIASGVHKPPRTILVPQDGSTRAREILPWAEQLARLHRASLVLLHVRPRGGRGEDPDASRRLSRSCSALRSRGIKASLRLEEGDPAEEILKACRNGDLLTLTTHGHGGLKRLLLGSIAEKVIHQAPVPVMIYKKPGKAGKLPSDLAVLKLFEQ